MRRRARLTNEPLDSSQEPKQDRKQRPKRKNSLLIRYLLIVLMAFLLWPMVVPVSIIVYFLPETLSSWRQAQHPQQSPYESRQDLTTMWHAEALRLGAAQPDEVSARLSALYSEMPEARMFWVDGEGRTQAVQPWQQLPEKWSASETVVFMKKSYDADPFTVVAFIGGDPARGFMVLQVDDILLEKNRHSLMDTRYLAFTMMVTFLVFIFLSWTFFYRFRKRLVRLEQAMSTVDRRGMPYPVEVRQEDEIGQLEHAFNRMIEELHLGKRREEKEEALRKQLIASLSHDLRTPLTIIRSHAYSLSREALSPEARQSVALIEGKSDDLNRLIDNLLSYSLLSAGKYPVERRQVDMVRHLRAAAAAWYPVLEEAGLEVHVSLPGQAVHWHTDPGWITRIVDNLLQNVVRHAKAGKYAGILLEEREGGYAVVIEDHGPGLESSSDEKGAGIGLEIVRLMSRELGLGYEMKSSSEDTRAILFEKSSS